MGNIVLIYVIIEQGIKETKSTKRRLQSFVLNVEKNIQQFSLNRYAVQQNVNECVIIEYEKIKEKKVV